MAEVNTSDRVALRPAVSGDESGILALLATAGLPTAGIEEWIGRFHVAELDGRMVGTAGLEIHGDAGLLRSLAVRGEMRGRGIGHRLAECVIDAARGEHLRRLYLLTETAEEYFQHHGFARVDRASVAPAVRGSVEFREACPATAVAMMLDLRARGR